MRGDTNAVEVFRFFVLGFLGLAESHGVSEIRKVAWGGVGGKNCMRHGKEKQGVKTLGARRLAEVEGKSAWGEPLGVKKVENGDPPTNPP